MTVAFPPAPTYADPILVDPVTEKPRFNPIWLKWYLDVANFISVSGGGGGGAADHESLAGLLGGAASEHYHLTSVQYNSALYARRYAATHG